MNNLQPSALQRALDAMQKGDWTSARVYAESALAEDPTSPDSHHALGAACWQTGSLDAAIAHLETSAGLRPDAACLHNLGVAYAARGKWAQACGALERSLELRPGHADTLAPYGRTLCELRRFEAARHVLQEALAADSGLAQGRIDLGWALCELRAFADARAVLLKAIDSNRGAARAHRLLTRVCRSLRHFQESADHALAAAELAPSGDSLTELALAQWSAGDLPGALAAVDRAFQLGVTNSDSHSCLLYMMQFDPNCPGEKLYLAHRSWAVTHTVRGSAPVFSDRTDTGRKLRIGYLTADLFTSPARHSRLPLLTHADTARFDIYHYSTQPLIGGEETRYGALSGLYRDVHLLSDAELVSLIRADQIDVLADLTGHHSFGRLRVIAERAAPVQIAYSTYPGTCGLEQMDYVLTDDGVTPAGTEREYSEKVWRLPSGSLMYAPPPTPQPTSPLPASANGYVTFGLFQRESKWRFRGRRSLNPN